MDIYVSNPEFTVTNAVNVTTCIWTKRYRECGDFEITLSATAENFAIMQPDYYVYRLDDDAVMIIERIVITEDVEAGNVLTVSGRSAESLLDRRVILGIMAWFDKPETIIRDIVNKNVLNPDLGNRAISGIRFGNVTGVTQNSTGVQYTGESVMTACYELADRVNAGIRIRKSNDFTSDKWLYFEMYFGSDKTQGENMVIFSEDYDNIISCEYTYDNTNFKNSAFVTGEGEGKNKKTVVVGSQFGRNLYELYVDGADLTQYAEESIMPDDAYIDLLRNRGIDELSEYRKEETLMATGNNFGVFKYREHWNLGDLVLVKNKYGINSKSRIIEVIENYDETGYFVYPTMETEEIL